MPTLNRSHLLRLSLRSAVDQTYEDLEIVVSDNLSEDATADVIGAFDQRRIVCVRPERRLTMPDNFEFGLHHARGQFVTFLTDDSYLLPDCIDRAMAEIERAGVPIAVWKNAGYFDERWIEVQRRNTLYIPRATFRTSRLSSQASLRRWFSNIRRSTDMPRSINSLCHRSVIDRAIAVQGRFFLAPAPDHSSGVAMLMNSDEYVFIDEPLVVDAVTPESTGASQSFTLGKSAMDFYASFERDIREVTFLGLPTTPAIIAKSFENAREYYGDRCPPLNIRNVIDELVDSVAKLEAYGQHVDALFAVIDDYVDQRMRSLRLAVAKRKLWSRAKWRAVRLLRSYPLLYRLEALRGMTVLRAHARGFAGLPEIADVVSRRNAAVRRHLAPRA